jgi:Yip1 domain
MEHADDSQPPRHNPHRQRLTDSLHLLKRYLKNPVQTMRELPDWDWPTLLFFYMSVAGSCGILGALVSRHLLQIIPGAILLPISATLGAFVATGFFYYTYIFFFKREIAIKTLFTIVILAVLPILFLSIFSSWLLPLNLIGFLASGLLLIVGLTESTHIDRRKITKLIGAIYLVYVAFWMMNTIHSRTEKEEYKDPVQDAVQILDKEKGN